MRIIEIEVLTIISISCEIYQLFITVISCSAVDYSFHLFVTGEECAAVYLISDEHHRLIHTHLGGQREQYSDF